jgi:hypothetical protein
MVYNESVNLPIWLRHYRRTAPTATLFVIDHASDDGSTDHVQAANKIPLPREEMDEWNRTRFINFLQRGLLEFYDVVIYTDCDELIVPDPAVSPSLEAHLAARSYDYAAPVGLNILHLVDVEPPIELDRPLLSQRRYCQFQSRMCKPVITRIPLAWEPGFHECDKPVHIDPDLYLFHTKAMDRGCALNRLHVTQKVTWSQKAIDSNHGTHHRYDDERFEREFFRDRVNQLRRQGLQPFHFEAEIARVRLDSAPIAAVFRIKHFSGPIAEIPERFRDAF